MKNLDPRDTAIWMVVETAAKKLAQEYRLTCEVKPMPRKQADSCYGKTTRKGKVFITLRWSDGKRLRAWEILDTVAHEVAHLRHYNHSEEWFELYGLMHMTLSGDRETYKLLRYLCQTS